jgi:hypothetical protein
MCTRLTQRIHSVEYKRGSQGGEDNMMDIDIVYEVVKHQGYIYMVHEYTKHQCDMNVVHEVTISIKLKCGRHGCDRMIVGLTTTIAISAYHHYRCEFKSFSCEVYSI